MATITTVEAQYIIKNLTIENQTILDPMMGTGTPVLATSNLRRKFVGIEKIKKHLRLLV